MSDADDDKDVLAAEYVLGTLDADDRANAQMLIAIDPAFAATVARWEQRIGELHALVEPVDPPAQNWEWIKARIAAVPPAGKVWLPSVAEAAATASPSAPPEPLPWAAPKPTPTPATEQPSATPPSATPPSAAQPSAAAPSPEVVQLSSRLRRFQRFTVAATALAATIAGVAVLREANPVLLPEALRPKPQIVEREVVRTVEVPGQRIAEFVAVFQQDDNLPAPAFLLTVDVERKTVSLRRVGAQQQPDKSFELWIVTPQQPRPRSLGLLAEEGFTVRRALADYDVPTLHNATFGISLEPQGGSPTGQPTGPVVHGRLIQTTPAAFPQTP